MNKLNELLDQVISQEATNRATVAATLLNLTRDSAHTLLTNQHINYLTLPVKGHVRPLSPAMKADYSLLSCLEAQADEANQSRELHFWSNIMTCELLFAYGEAATLISEHDPTDTKRIQAYRDLSVFFPTPVVMCKLLHYYKSLTQQTIEAKIRAGESLSKILIYLGEEITEPVLGGTD